MKRNPIPRDIAKRYSKCGIKLIRANDLSDRNKIGIHLQNPTSSTLWEALETAMRDLFPAVYVHYDLPHSHSCFTPEMRRSRFQLILGGAA